MKAKMAAKVLKATPTSLMRIVNTGQIMKQIEVIKMQERSLIQKVEMQTYTT